MNNKSPAHLVAAGSTMILLLIMFIDGVGMSLVLPLISELFSQNVNSIVSYSIPDWGYSLYYAGSLACFSGAMVIGASFLGQLSDRTGRKKALQLALAGAVVGYLMCALAVVFQSPVLFLAGRVIDGLTAGSIPVAQAMLTDINSQKSKMTSIGLIMFAVTSGYMFGPVIAGIAFINYTQHLLYVPFLFVAFLCMLCMGFLAFMRESYKADNTKPYDVTIAFRQIKALLQMSTIRYSLLGFFLFQCAWTLYYQYLPTMSLNGTHLSPASVTVLMAEVGAAMCIAFCFVVPKVQGKLNHQQLAILCLFSFVVLSLSSLIGQRSEVQLQVISALMATCYAVGYSATLTYMIGAADDHQKGLIFGSVASVCAISATVTALLGSRLMDLGHDAFFSLLTFAAMISLLLIFKSTRLVVSSINSGKMG